MSSSKPVIDVLTLNGIAPGNVAAHRAVGFNDAQATVAGQNVKGIAESAASAGAAFPVRAIGTAIAETAGDITAGARLITDNQGRVTPYVDSGHIFAEALETSTGAGKFVEVLLR